MMRSYNEYIECSCGAWARIIRAEDRQHRDKIVCASCGRVTIEIRTQVDEIWAEYMGLVKRIQQHK